MSNWKLWLSVLALSTAVCSAARGADEALIAQAKKEGEVVWYSTKVLESGIRPLAAAFEAKYGIKVQASKLTSDALVLKVLNEARAGRMTVDVFDGSSTITAAMEAGLVEPYKPQEAASFAAHFKDPNGLWTASNSFVAGQAINTNVVKPQDIPKTADDLLDPKWAGRKIVFSTEYTVAGIHGFVGSLIKERGEAKTIEFLQKLKRNSPVGIESTPSAVMDRLASGEFAICIGCINTQVERLREKNAPVAFLNDLQPIVAFLSANAIVKNAPHPAAAKLFTEFTMSKEGQAILDAGAYLVPRPDIQSKYSKFNPTSGLFKTTVVTPDDAAVGLPKWKDTIEKTLR